MSRIGRQPIPLPQGVSVTLEGGHIKVKGPKGELERTLHPEMIVTHEDDALRVSRPSDERRHRALHGLTRALLNNMVIGVSEGFKRVLEIEGVGYRAEMAGNNLVLYLGYSHSITVPPPEGVRFAVEERGRVVTITGADKEMVGQIAANIRKLRPPEPYKGKGIRYQGEVIRRKAGKAGKTK